MRRVVPVLTGTGTACGCVFFVIRHFLNFLGYGVNARDGHSLRQVT